VAERTIEKHVPSSLSKFQLPGMDDHLRVLAVLTFLEGR
jgi:hypothetical protein